mgnify:CR=1 FL=1
MEKLSDCMASALTLGGLFRYPVKSFAGESFSALDVDARGLVYDRHWMLVDRDGRFLTQRQVPRMALIGSRVTRAGDLLLRAPGRSDIEVGPATGDPVEVGVWRDRVRASPVDPAADAWLQEFLALDCRLVALPDGAIRAVDPDYARPADQVGFVDGFPFLLISQASQTARTGGCRQP